MRRGSIEQDRTVQAFEGRIRQAEGRAAHAERWMRGLEQQRDEARALADAASHEIRALRAELQLLQASTSWRVTAPLRRVVSALRKARGRGAAAPPGDTPLPVPASSAPAETPALITQTPQARSILILDHSVPRPDQDAGSRAIMDLMLCLRDAGWHIHFWPQDRAWDEAYTPALESCGVEVIDHRWAGSIGQWLRKHGAALDRILISRATVAEALGLQVMAASTAPIAYYGHDIAFARLAMEAAIRETPVLADEVAKTRAFERRLWRLFDTVIYLSEEEAATVRALEPAADARAIVPFSYAHFVHRKAAPAGQTILFVAGFAHAPNVDAAEFLVYQVLPLVQAQCPEARVALVGSHPNWAVSALAGASVTVTGWVSDAELARWYQESRVAVVPLRFGAGVKGKVVQALQQGLPLVATPVGAQGIEGLSDIALVRGDAAEIAAALVGLLRDDSAWMAQSRAQTAFTESRYSRDAMRHSVLRALDATDPDSSP